MNHDELIQHGKDALDLVRRACLRNNHTLSHPDRVARAEQVLSKLSERLADNTYPVNPKYHRQDELTAAMLLIATYDPLTYRSIFQFSFPEFHSDLKYVHGIVDLNHLLGCLSDDHELCLHLNGPVPVVGNVTYFPRFIEGATPMSVLGAIRPIAVSLVEALLKERHLQRIAEIKPWYKYLGRPGHYGCPECPFQRGDEVVLKDNVEQPSVKAQYGLSRPHLTPGQIYIVDYASPCFSSQGLYHLGVQYFIHLRTAEWERVGSYYYDIHLKVVRRRDDEHFLEG